MEQFEKLCETININVDKLEEIRDTKYTIPLKDRLTDEEEALLSKINKINNYYEADTFGFTDEPKIKNILFDINVYDYINVKLPNFDNINKIYLELNSEDFLKFVREQKVDIVYKKNIYMNHNNYGDMSDLYIELDELLEIETEDEEVIKENYNYDYLDKYRHDMDTWYDILEKVDYTVPYMQQYICVREQCIICSNIATSYLVPEDSIINKAIETLHTDCINRYKKEIEMKQEQEVEQEREKFEKEQILKEDLEKQERLNIENLEKEFMDMIINDEKFKFCGNQKLREIYLREKIEALDIKFKPLIFKLCVCRSIGEDYAVLGLSDYGLMFLNNAKNYAKLKR